MNLSEYDVHYRQVLRERLEVHGLVPAGSGVLCLGARLGTEVKAFLDLGCFATGIDLNPGKDNLYVLPGDFHETQFASASLDAVFTNSLDHAFDLETVLSEVRRLLKPGGVFVVELIDSASGGYYESTAWSSPDEVVRLLVEDGFTVAFRVQFTDPWDGEHVCLRAPSGR